MKKEYNPNDDWATLPEICVAVVALNQVENPDFNPQEYCMEDLIAYAKNLSIKLYGGHALFALNLNRALGDKGTLLATASISPDVVVTEIVKVMLGASATADRNMLSFVRGFFETVKTNPAVK